MTAFPLLDLLQMSAVLRFPALFGGMIVFPAQKSVGETLHVCQLFFRVVGVLIALPVFQILHQFCGRVADNQWNRFRQLFDGVLFAVS